jgi:hypothetical protein
MYGIFDFDQGPIALTFRLEPDSTDRIDSIPILAVAQIPAQMEFSVETAVNHQLRSGDVGGLALSLDPAWRSESEPLRRAISSSAWLEMV